MEKKISYIIICISSLFMLYQLPGIASELVDPFTHQLWNSLFQLAFCIYGYVVMRKYALVTSDILEKSGELKNEVLNKIKTKCKEIKEAFVYNDEDDKVVRVYADALVNTFQTFKEIRWIWLAWSAFYVISIFKNIYYKGWLIDDISLEFYYFDTLETMCSNIVCVFSFSIYLKLNTLRYNKESDIYWIWIGIIFISLIQLSLLFINNINPLEVNWAFQVIGCSISGIALVLLFSRLCEKSINPKPWFVVIFVTYAILQPLIFLHQTEAVILRMPKKVREKEASSRIEKAVTSTLLKLRLELANNANSQTAALIISDTLWLKGTTNSNNLVEMYNQVDFDDSMFKTALSLTPLHDRSEEIIVEELKTDSRIYLVAQNSMTKYAIIRRWYLLFGKAWFLIYIGWLYRTGRILKYFMSHDRNRLKKEMKAFNNHKENLPGINFLKLKSSNRNHDQI